MKVLLRCLLVLAVVSPAVHASDECPSQCTCDFWSDNRMTYECQVDKNLMSIFVDNRKLYVDCKGSNLTFTDKNFPIIESNQTVEMLELTDCSLQILPCINRSYRVRGEENSLLNVKELTIEHDERRNVENLSNKIGTEVNDFSTTPNLQKITFSRVLTHLPPGFFSGLKHLKTISIFVNNELKTLDSRSIANVPSLETLEITLNPLEILAEDCFAGSSGILTLIMYNNKLRSLPQNVFADQVQLRTLDMSRNLLEDLPKGIFATLEKLEDVTLDDNRLMVLPESLFAGLGNLKRVSLNSNYLTTIDNSCFQGNHQLKDLSIDSNRLTLRPEPGSAKTKGKSPTSPFASLHHLKTLNLTKNRIDKIFDDWRTNLVNLTYLNLDRNLITDIKLQDVQFKAKHLTINLRLNKIKAVHFPVTSPDSSGQDSSNNTVLLDNNPLVCDCRLYPLLLRLQGSWSTAPQFEVGRKVCPSSSAKFKGNYIKNLAPSAFDCQLNLDDCPENCSSCILHAPKNYLEYDCDSIPRIMPKSTNVVLKLREQSEGISNLNVETLNLTGLQMKEVLFEPPKMLKVLDLSNNSITVPPVKLFKANVSLYLSRNPLKCECEYHEELSLLVNSKLVLDFHDVTCDGGEKIDLNDLCHSPWMSAIIASVIVILLAILITVLIVTCNKYSNEIIVYMMHKNIGKHYFQDEDIDKEYDVFVSFSHKDLEFIEKHLIPKLEDEFKLNICIHYRDWNVGEFISTQITKSVQSSRKTLIVLSKNFLESTWATVEFNVAHTSAIRESKARIVLILLEDINNETILPDDIKAYISTNTYLKWGDLKFWEKLRRALPERKKKFVWRNTIINADDDTEKARRSYGKNTVDQWRTIEEK